MTVETNPQTPPVTRHTPNRVTRFRVPIIFVPGIMGSRFNVVDENVAWDPDSDGNMLRWGSRWTGTKRTVLDFSNAGEVLLDPSNDFSTDHDERVIRGFGGVRWASYGTFLEFLEGLSFGSHHTPIYAYGYDWRQPVVQLGVQLAADILGTRVSQGGNRADPIANRYEGGGILARENATRCIILTHSMGGLVTRAALKASSTLREKTIAVLHGVQPVTGAPTIYRRLITGMFRPVDGGGAVADRVLRSILGENGPDFAQVASVLPGALQLLPSNLYRQDADRRAISTLSWRRFAESHGAFHQLTTDVYDAFNNAPTDSPPGFALPNLPREVRTDLHTRVSGLRRFHEFLERWKLDGKTWAFYGNGANSDSSVHFDLPPPPGDITEERRVFGSNTFTARRPDGTIVTLDHERDMVRNGYSQTVPGKTASAANPWGFGPFGDGTVAAVSGAALFGPDETSEIEGTSAPDFSTIKQFEFAGLEHEPAYRDQAVQRFCRQWLRAMIAGL